MFKQSGISLNLRTAVTSWSYNCFRVKWCIDYLNDHSHGFEALRHIFKTFHEAYTIFVKSREIFSTFCGLFLLLNTRRRRDFGRFSRNVNKYLFFFFRFTDFLRSSKYFSSIVISINFYHVECGGGRQPRILVDNFWIPRSKTRTFSTPGFLTEPCYYFFSH